MFYDCAGIEYLQKKKKRKKHQSNRLFQTGPELSFSQIIQVTDSAQILNKFFLMHKINADYKKKLRKEARIH